MAKRYYCDERPKERSKTEQAEINERNLEEMRQTLIKYAKCAADYIDKQQEISAALRDGNIALACEELSTLKFNDNYTMAKYGGKEVEFREGGLESEMLGILIRATNSNNKTVTEKQLASSLEGATGKYGDFRTVRNARGRLNAKIQNGLGLPNVIKLDNGKYGLDERFFAHTKK